MDVSALLLEQWLPAYGPWLLFVMAVLETCFVTGLVVPSGLATSLGTVLALQGQLPLAAVVTAAMAGGWVGDVLGFGVGRVVGERVLTGDGRWARLVSRRHRTLSRFFGRHPVYSVTLARCVSFVRTLMPMAAGMSGMRVSTYLVFELPGLVGWVILYVGVGVLAGESWEIATRIVGVGGAVAFAVAGVVMGILVRRRRNGGVGDGEPADAPPPDAPAASAVADARAGGDPC